MLMVFKVFLLIIAIDLMVIPLLLALFNINEPKKMPVKLYKGMFWVGYFLFIIAAFLYEFF